MYVLSVEQVSNISKIIYYRVVLVPIPEQRLGRYLDSVPLSLVWYVSCPMMGLPPPPPSPPLQDSPGFLAPCSSPVFSLFSPFASSSSVSVHSAITSSSVWSSVVRSADSSGGMSTNNLSWFPASRMKVCPPTCASGGTWLWCGWRGVGDGSPRDSHWFPQRIDRRRLACVFFWSLDFS